MESGKREREEGSKRKIKTKEDNGKMNSRIEAGEGRR